MLAQSSEERHQTDTEPISEVDVSEENLPENGKKREDSFSSLQNEEFSTLEETQRIKETEIHNFNGPN